MVKRHRHNATVAAIIAIDGLAVARAAEFPCLDSRKAHPVSPSLCPHAELMDRPCDAALFMALTLERALPRWAASCPALSVGTPAKMHFRLQSGRTNAMFHLSFLRFFQLQPFGFGT
jgi:hypothetical protein